MKHTFVCIVNAIILVILFFIVTTFRGFFILFAFVRLRLFAFIFFFFLLLFLIIIATIDIVIDTLFNVIVFIGRMFVFVT